MDVSKHYPTYREIKGKEVLIKNPEDHQRDYPDDYEDLVDEADAKPVPVNEQIAAALVEERSKINAQVSVRWDEEMKKVSDANAEVVLKAVNAEKARCAAVADSVAGPVAAKIARIIRGEKVDAATPPDPVVGPATAPPATPPPAPQD